MDKELLTSSDLRGILQISEATVWRKVKSGALPAPIKVCGLTRWRRAEIAARDIQHLGLIGHLLGGARCWCHDRSGDLGCRLRRRLNCGLGRRRLNGHRLARRRRWQRPAGLDGLRRGNRSRRRLRRGHRDRGQRGLVARTRRVGRHLCSGWWGVLRWQRWHPLWERRRWQSWNGRGLYRWLLPHWRSRRRCLRMRHLALHHSQRRSRHQRPNPGFRGHGLSLNV